MGLFWTRGYRTAQTAHCALALLPPVNQLAETFLQTALMQIQLIFKVVSHTQIKLMSTSVQSEASLQILPTPSAGPISGVSLACGQYYIHSDTFHSPGSLGRFSYVQNTLACHRY